MSSYFFYLFYFSQVDISRRVTLERLPKVLILHLKRFIYSKAGSQKLQKVIDYPLELSIGKGNFRLILLLKNINIRAVLTVCFYVTGFLYLEHSLISIFFFLFKTELLSSNVKNKYSAAQKTYKLFAGKVI